MTLTVDWCAQLLLTGVYLPKGVRMHVCVLILPIKSRYMYKNNFFDFDVCVR